MKAPKEELVVVLDNIRSTYNVGAILEQLTEQE